MSIWGPGPFENDDAADWLTDLDEAPSLSLIEDAVSELSDPAHLGYAEVTECCEAVAAADILSRLCEGSVSSDMLEGATWSSLGQELRTLSSDGLAGLTAMALKAVDRVLSDEGGSELLQLWKEDKPGLLVWSERMKALLQRLQAIASRQA